MGCCFSSTGDRHPETEHRHSSGGGHSKSPPPSALEEETVKEVLLLETPIIAPKLVDERIKEAPPGNQDWKVESGPAAVAITADIPLKKGNEEIIISEVSEVSEMCSYSESFSNATTAAQDKREDDDDGVVNQRPPLRKRRAPPTGGKGRGGVARRGAAAAPSPEKRGQVVPLRPVRGRSMAGQPRNVAEENGRRRDPGEDSGRRLRSPVRREEVGERRNVNDEKRPMATREPPNDVVPAEEAESLENPVVSLECFIFL
ncbi:hypothetical protein ABFS82_08G109100 [Erythranthe guttata]|uniref:Uncharacterized protein n=1 Tax=Erythranthe guttata TaxID=4155 RepID=A0A022QFV7_ERYGU|nr:PREDICTED: uncharacterized protein LOC105970560 [Erythranthe guttata]EYU26128.1 hypothetical protein MIMGU_mgv1a026836mg [Erythranthe guttata]|eukprot:XP_012850849.1 PREDICTED: uncharacterized protein LOC105970560 [Erythranthe guttata]